MLELDTRQAILRLRAEGHGARTIARALSVSRNAVRAVLRSGEAAVPRMERPSALDPHLALVQTLYVQCKGNLVRVHEELGGHGVTVGYPTLTAFCRRIGLGEPPKEPAGRYHFEPGEEMQHDTSPHSVEIGGARRVLQCASLVMCHSRMLFTQCYGRWNRYWCKVFLTDALLYLGGAAARCMIDNSSVIIAHGTGPDAVPAPEMAAFAERFGFDFEAHELGDANRSGRVERPFHYIENNFYPGRRFASLVDLNAQLRVWCDQKNASYKKHIRAVPRELFVAERTRLEPLPLHVPDVYEQVVRIVDVEGYVHLHTNRYSLPPTHKNRSLLHRSLRVRAGKDRVRIFDGHELVCEHSRLEDGAHGRSTLPEHVRARRGAPGPARRQAEQEKLLRAASPVIGQLVDALKTREGGRAARSLRRLRQLYLDYPTEALVAAVSVALTHGLFDLRRIEELVLRHVGQTFFRLPRPGDERDGNECDDDYPNEDDDG